ncbi:hypothetical protein M569_15719, partial [Genlisea aurea]
DKLEMKAVKDGSASYAALEKKAELYEKLMRGEVSDEEDEEKYSVDFFRKGVEQNIPWPPQRPETTTSQAHESNAEDADSVPFMDAKAPGLGHASSSVDRNHHKQFVMEVHEEAKQAREKVSEIKHRRQEQAAARREKLMKAYLRMQLEKKNKA